MKAFFAVLLALCLLLCGCSKGETSAPAAASDPAQKGYRNTVLYYATDDGFLLPVMKAIPWEEGIGKAALRELTEGSAQGEALSRRGLQATIPAGTKLGLSINETGLARVDFEAISALSSKAAEERMLASIAATLMEFPTVDSVAFSLQGEGEAVLPMGTALKGEAFEVRLNPETKNALSVSASGASVKKLSLYFPNTSASLYVPVSRYTEGKADLQALCEALLSGPEDPRLLACFPEGTALDFAEVYEDTACVGFNSAFLGDASTQELQKAAYKALYHSVRALPGIEKLEVYVDGELYLPEDTALLTGLCANTF